MVPRATRNRRSRPKFLALTLAVTLALALTLTHILRIKLREPVSHTIKL